MSSELTYVGKPCVGAHHEVPICRPRRLRHVLDGVPRSARDAGMRVGYARRMLRYRFLEKA